MIIAAAVQYKGLIFTLPAPNRHYHIVHLMHQLGLPPESRQHQGFLTDEGRFVDRKEARKIAYDECQIGAKTIHPADLFTEDLWPPGGANHAWSSGLDEVGSHLATIRALRNETENLENVANGYLSCVESAKIQVEHYRLDMPAEAFYQITKALNGEIPHEIEQE